MKEAIFHQRVPNMKSTKIFQLYRTLGNTQRKVSCARPEAGKMDSNKGIDPEIDSIRNKRSCVIYDDESPSRTGRFGTGLAGTIGTSRWRIA